MSTLLIKRNLKLSSAQCQCFASGAFMCSHLNFWRSSHSACKLGHDCHFGMVFLIEPIESEEPVSCLELRELSPAVSLLEVLERSTIYILPSTLKASEFTSDKWVQIDLPVPAAFWLSRVGDAGQIQCCMKKWISTCMVSPYQGMWLRA